MTDMMTDMPASPRLSLPLLAAGQAQKEVTHNEALVLIDSLIAPLVEGVGTISPPPGAAVGQAWIVGSAPTGAWVGKAGQLAVLSAGGWRFADLPVGASVCERATLSQWRRGAAAWIAPPHCASPSGGATVDEGARSAIAAIVAALVTHGLAVTA